MPVVFNGWTEYDDGSGSAALTWGVGQPPLLTAEALRQAVLERCAVAGQPVPSVLQADLTAGTTPRPYEVHSSIHTTVTALIPAFVNHIDSGGDWDGSTVAPAPAWTESAMLAQLGAAERIVELWSYEWAEQTRDMLNLMRWTKWAARHCPNSDTMEAARQYDVEVYDVATGTWNHAHMARPYPVVGYCGITRAAFRQAGYVFSLDNVYPQGGNALPPMGTVPCTLADVETWCEANGTEFAADADVYAFVEKTYDDEPDSAFDGSEAGFGAINSWQLAVQKSAGRLFRVVRPGYDEVRFMGIGAVGRIATDPSGTTANWKIDYQEQGGDDVYDTYVVVFKHDVAGGFTLR